MTFVKLKPVAALCGAVLVVGCGSGGSDENSESRVAFIPDVNSALTAAEQILTVFDPGNLQRLKDDPQCLSNEDEDCLGSLDLPETHGEPLSHLALGTDPVWGDFVALSLHLQADGDREVAWSDSDRQRAEFKSYSNSPDSLLCGYGDEMRVQFRFNRH